MVNWLDLLLTLAVLTGLAAGYRRGLLGQATALVGYLIALKVAGRLAGPAVAWQEPYLGLVATLTRVLHARIPLPPELARAPLRTLAPDRLAQVIGLLPLPPSYQGNLTDKLAELAAAEGHRPLADVLFTQIATGAVTAFLFGLIALATAWGLVVVAGRLSGLLDHLPLLGRANRWLGALIGGAEVVLLATLILGLLNPLLALPAASGLALAVAESTGAGWLMTLYAALTAWLFGPDRTVFLKL